MSLYIIYMDSKERKKRSGKSESSKLLYKVNSFPEIEGLLSELTWTGKQRLRVIELP